MSATGYQIEWLLHRYNYDAEARWTAPLEQWMNDHPRDICRIVDLGAGLASNLRFWVSRIGTPQDWALVEIDQKLIREGGCWLDQLPAGISARYVQQDFMKFLQEHPAPDLLLCNALLDVLTAHQITGLLDYLWIHRVPLLASINYSGMEFYPALPEDQRFIGAYEAHMEREQPAGFALGRSLEPFLSTVRGPFEVVMHPSPWEIPAQDTLMLHFLLDYMEKAVPEMLPQHDHPAFRDWLRVRREQVKERRLSARVLHIDAWIQRSEKKVD